MHRLFTSMWLSSSTPPLTGYLRAGTLSYITSFRVRFFICETPTLQGCEDYREGIQAAGRGCSLHTRVTGVTMLEHLVRTVPLQCTSFQVDGSERQRMRSLGCVFVSSVNGMTRCQIYILVDLVQFVVMCALDVPLALCCKKLKRLFGHFFLPTQLR